MSWTPVNFPLRGAWGIFPVLSGEKRDMPLWVKMMLPDMFQLPFTDIPHIFTCVQHARAMCNIISAELTSNTVWPAYNLAKAQFLWIWTWESLFPGDGKGHKASELCSLHGSSDGPCAEPKGGGSIPTRGSPKDVGVSASGLVCSRSSPAASKNVNLAQSTVTLLGEVTQGPAVKQVKCCWATILSLLIPAMQRCPCVCLSSTEPPGPKEAGLPACVLVAVALRICLSLCGYVLQKSGVLHQAVPWNKGLMSRKYLSQRA